MLVKVFCRSVIFLLDHGLVNPMACIDLKFKLTNLPMSGELWRPQRVHCNGQDSWLSLCHRNQNGENPFFQWPSWLWNKHSLDNLISRFWMERSRRRGQFFPLQRYCSVKELLIKIEWSSFGDCQNCLPLPCRPNFVHFAWRLNVMISINVILGINSCWQRPPPPSQHWMLNFFFNFPQRHSRKER